MSKNDASELIDEVVEKQPKTKKKGCFRKMCQIFCTMFLLFLIWYIMVGRSIPLKISPETTYVTEPRTADGKWIDYCGAFEQLYYLPEMKTDDNGYRMIVRHLGLPELEMSYLDVKTNETKQYELDQEALRLQGYEKLGLDPNIKPDMVYKPHGTAVWEYSKETHPDDEKKQGDLNWELYDKTMQTPWTLEEFPMLQPWVEQTFPVLDLVSEAVSKPAFRTPLIVPEGYESLNLLMINGNLETVQEWRSYARDFQARFQYRLAGGDIDGAIADKIATQRLARHAAHQGTLINFLVGIAIEGIGIAEGIAGNMEAQPTAEQIRKLMQLYDELPPTITFENAMESERLIVLDALQGYAKGKPQSPNDVMPSGFVRPLVGLALDWNIVLSRANLYLDGKLEPTANVPMSPFGYLATFLYSRKKRSEDFIDIHAALLLPAVQAAHEAQRRCDCIGNMQRITLAMLLYHAENGTLPHAFSVDENGQPLHSWRVLLLPYLGDEELTALHEQIRLDEPWDSEHNRQFHEKNLKIYQCPSAELQSGKTSYCVIIGEETPFGNDGIGKSLDGFGPNSGGMPLVTERRASANWMDPTFDVTFVQAKEGINGTPEKELAIGSYHTGGANFGLRNGGVSFFSDTIEPELWEKVLQGKEKVE